MFEKLRTLAWFAKRPDHWLHAGALIYRKMLPNRDAPELRVKAQGPRMGGHTRGFRSRGP